MTSDNFVSIVLQVPNTLHPKTFDGLQNWAHLFHGDSIDSVMQQYTKRFGENEQEIRIVRIDSEHNTPRTYLELFHGTTRQFKEQK